MPFALKNQQTLITLKIFLSVFLTLQIHPQAASAYDWLKETNGSYDAASPYIPKNLEDAHQELEKLLDQNEINRIKNNPEDFMSRYHHGLGTWMRNNWGLWKGSRLKDYFNSIGVQLADDMSSIILDSFWCKLHNQPFRLQERVLYYQAYLEANLPPQGMNPKNGAKIDWLSIRPPKNNGDYKNSRSPEQFKGTLHLGVS